MKKTKNQNRTGQKTSGGTSPKTKTSSTVLSKFCPSSFTFPPPFFLSALLTPQLSPCSPFSFSPRRLVFVLGTSASGVSRQPVGRPALAPAVPGAARLSAQPHRGQTQRGGSGPRAVQHPAGRSRCTALTCEDVDAALTCGKILLFLYFYMQLSIGADPQRTKRNFHGCLENLLYNGLNMLESAKMGHSHQVALVVSIYSRKTSPRSHDLWSWTASSGSLEMTAL